MKLRWISVAGCALLATLGAARDKKSTMPPHYFVYIGTYEKGIYGYSYDAATAAINPLGIVGAVANPSFLTVDPALRYLYAVSELTGPGNPVGGVAGFSMDRKNGSLRPINTVSSEGAAPCHLAMDHTGKLLLAANYTSGSVSVFPVAGDGSLSKASQVLKYSGSSVDKDRQESPHAHEVVISADNRRAFIPDLGLDQIHVLNLDPAGQKVTQNNPPSIKVAPGSGPRHMVLHPNGHFAYVLSELKSEVTAYTYEAQSGQLKPLQTVPTVPSDFTETNNPAELELDAAGKFLYASNRGHDSIAVFAVDRAKGTLTQIQVVSTEGQVPRSFSIDPSGRYLFAGNQKSDKIVVFKIDPNEGKISSTGQVLHVPSPVCIKFVPAL